MRKRLAGLIVAAGLGLIVSAGCEKKEPPPAFKPREAPKFDETTPATAPAEAPPTEGTQLPPGHPPISRPAGMPGMPPGHPATSGPETAAQLHFDVPAGWVTKPARFMTSQVYSAPKAAPESEDADVAVSSLDSFVPLQMNVERWCTQFELPQGKTCAETAKTQKLEGTKYATTLVELSGAFKGGSMFAPPGPAKPDYKMLAAEIITQDRPYFVKMVGPAKTVDHWRDAFMQMVRSAK